MTRKPLPPIEDGIIVLTPSHEEYNRWERGDVVIIQDQYYKIMKTSKRMCGHQKVCYLEPRTADAYARRPGRKHLGSDYAREPDMRQIKVREGQAIETPKGWFHVKKIICYTNSSGEGDIVFGHEWYGKGNYLPSKKEADVINTRYAKARLTTPEGRLARINEIVKELSGGICNDTIPDDMTSMMQIKAYGHIMPTSSDELWTDGNKIVRATTHYDDCHYPRYHTVVAPSLANELIALNY